MRLYFICSPVSGNGGIETVLSDVITNLSSHYNISLILTNNPENKEWLSSISSNAEILMPHNNKSASLFLMYRLSRIKNNDNVIILGANLIKYAFYMRKVLIKKWAIISWIHFSLKHQNMFDPHNLLYADYHLAISSRIKQELIDLGVSQNKVYLIYNPILPRDLTILPDNNRFLRLVFIGHITLDGQKNLRELFDGIKLYQEHYGQIQLDLFGSMDEEDECKKYANKLGIDQSLVWHQWTSNPWKIINEEVKPNALILTSKFEGLPMVALEAMSYGVPCILAQFDGFSDIIKERINGLSYPQKDIPALANSIHMLKTIDFNSEKIKDSISEYYSPNYYRRLLASLQSIINH